MVKTLAERYVEAATQAYLETLLWAERDNSGNPLCNTFTTQDFGAESVAQARRDVRHFIETAHEVIGPDAFDDLGRGAWFFGEHGEPNLVGHNFALTRNGHGTGFWDRNITHGDALTELCIVFGPVYVYVGGGGKVHIM